MLTYKDLPLSNLTTNNGNICIYNMVAKFGLESLNHVEVKVGGDSYTVTVAHWIHWKKTATKFGFERLLTFFVVHNGMSIFLIL